MPFLSAILPFWQCRCILLMWTICLPIEILGWQRLYVYITHLLSLTAYWAEYFDLFPRTFHPRPEERARWSIMCVRTSIIPKNSGACLSAHYTVDVFSHQERLKPERPPSIFSNKSWDSKLCAGISTMVMAASARSPCALPPRLWSYQPDGLYDTFWHVRLMSKTSSLGWRAHFWLYRSSPLAHDLSFSEKRFGLYSTLDGQSTYYGEKPKCVLHTRFQELKLTHRAGGVPSSASPGSIMFLSYAYFRYIKDFPRLKGLVEEALFWWTWIYYTSKQNKNQEQEAQ